MPTILRVPGMKQPSMRIPLKTTLTMAAALAVALVCSGTARAQWAWKDENGRLVFSDRQPPSNVKPENIVRQPAQSSAVRKTVEAAPSEGATPGAARSVAERDMEFRKRQAERTEAERKQAEELANVARRNADCERARGYLRSLEDGARIMRTDPQGNREFLDDTQRATEIARAREAVARSCTG